MWGLGVLSGSSQGIRKARVIPLGVVEGVELALKNNRSD
jgi:hypothetical protein